MRRTIHALLTASLLAAVAAPVQGAPTLAERDAFNREYEDLWSRLEPAMSSQISQQVSAQLAAVHEVTSTREITVPTVKHVLVNLRGGPGFPAVTDDHLELALPLQGSWSFDIEAEAHIRVKVWRWWTSFTVPIRLIVEDVRLRAALDLDLTDPNRPTVQRIAPPQVDLRVRLRSRNLFYGLLLRLLSPVANRMAHQALDDALRNLTPMLSAQQGAPGPVPGDGAAAYTDSGRQVDFAGMAARVAEKARRTNMPYGTLLSATMSTPATDSWETAYAAAGPGNVGTVNPAGYGDAGDSAIWTGHYLAAEAFRYHETSDPEALEHVRHALVGVGNLLDVYGGSGLLARYTAPLASDLGRSIVAHHATTRQATLHGETWVAEDLDNNISRDQYCGVFFGLMTAHDFVNDPSVQAECVRRLEMMLDYLIARGWWVDEDRPAFSLAPGSTALATFWRGTATQRLSYLLEGERMSPGRYTADLQQVAPLAVFNWLGEWIDCFSLDGYYKFNLSHVTYYDYFRLETDPTRWQDTARGFWVMRRYVGHHRNPHFDLITTTVEPSLRATLFPASREALRRFVTRNHRAVAPAVVDLSLVQWVTFTMPVQTGSTISHQQIRMPSEPLDVPLQEPETSFLWQRNPFHAATPNQGSPYVEKPGIDLLLPYWMGRNLGAF